MKQTMEQIKAYIAAQGYDCGDALVENYYLSLVSRPFVILAGLSDTDLTLLPELFAGAVGATAENGRYKCLTVEYDWMDSSDLFGHLDLWGKFVPGVILDFLIQAREDPDHPYFLCLDKLILSRAEYYLREILNIIEAGETGMDAGALVPAIYYGRDAGALQKYGQIPRLKNLYIIGTLNLDETSFPLNQKFMDRIHSLQLSKEDIFFTGKKAPAEPKELNNDFLLSPLKQLEHCTGYEKEIERIIGVIEALNKILMQGNAYVGYQIRNDMILYLLNNIRTGVLEDAAALDHMITQKVLIRAQGSARTAMPMLEQLANYCAGRYPKAEKKIAFMMEKCRLEDYTAYWV
ncbi:MAG: hypothetical protein IJO45_06860 [Oscillospiraceae bacterium]|nr:hypothetical protein [Oscillospiraceae bacterium]